MAVLARVASSSGELKQSRKKAAVEVWEAAFDIVRDRLVLAVETVRDPDRVLESVAHQAIPRTCLCAPPAKYGCWHASMRSMRVQSCRRRTPART